MVSSMKVTSSGVKDANCYYIGGGVVGNGYGNKA